MLTVPLIGCQFLGWSPVQTPAMEFQIRIAQGLLNEDLIWTDVDGRMCELLGKDAPALLETPFTDSLPDPASEESFFAGIKQARQSGSAVLRLRLLRHPGDLTFIARMEIRYLSLNAYLVQALDSSRSDQIEESIRSVAIETAGLTGQAFFDAVTRRLSEIMGMRMAYIGRRVTGNRIRTLSVWNNGPSDNIEYDLPGTPCEEVTAHEPIFYRDSISSRFPDDPLLHKLGMVSYIGIPLHNQADQPIGLLVLLHDTLTERIPELDPVLAFLAARTAAEIEQSEARTALLEELQSERNYMSTFLETTGALVCVLNTDGHIVAFNRKCETPTGYSRSEVYGKDVIDLFIPDEERSGVRDVVKSLSAGNFPLSYENHWVSRNGDHHWIAWRNMCTKKADGSIDLIIATGIDITEKKRMEADLVQANKELADQLSVAESERQLRREIMETSGAVVVILNDNAEFIEVNHEVEVLTGYDRSQILGQHVTFLLPTETQEEVMQSVGENLQTSTGESGEAAWVGAEGQIIWLSWKSTIIPDPVTSRKLLIAIGIDITERRRAEIEQKQLVQQLERTFHEIVHERSIRQQILDTSSGLIIVVDVEGMILEFNHGCEAVSGYRRSEAVGRHISFLIPPDERPSVIDGLSIIPAVQNERNAVHAWLTRDGQRRWILWNNSTFIDQESQMRMMIGTGIDITETKRAEEELAQAYDDLKKLNDHLEDRVRDRTIKLEAANQELEAFSYSVSHDLRAPLRHITGFIDLIHLKTDSLDPKTKKYLDTIAGSAKRMGTLIDDLLQFSRMGRMEMTQSQVDLNRIVERVIGDLSHETNGRMIEWHLSPLPKVRGDQSMLFLVFQNLIGNAIKFTRNRDAARITIFSSKAEKGETIHIKDNGVGFDMQYADKLFGVFQRLHRADEFEGTGIGLANVRRIIHRHGGNVQVSANPDEGADFFFTLPEILS